MKKILFAVFAFILSSASIFSQIVNTIRLSATKDIFTLEECDLPDAYILRPSSPQISYSYKGLNYKTIGGAEASPRGNNGEFEPCLLYYTIQLPLEDDEEYVSFTMMEQKEELIYEDIYIHHAPFPIPIGDVAVATQNYITYSDNYYPNNQCGHFMTAGYMVSNNEIFDRKALWFSFCPFRYDTVEKNLYLLKDVSLNITLSQTDADAIQHVEAEAAPNGRNIYDLTGRRLSAVPQKGMYIQNGKKILKK